MKPMKPRLLSLLCALAISLSLAPTALAAQSFPDVQPGDWYYDTVMDLVDMGAVSGYPSGTFGPENKISAAEFCKIALGILPGGEGINVFGVDAETAPAELEAINPGYWANDVLLAAILRGVGIFSTEQAEWARPMTRAEMACALALLYQNSEEQPEMSVDTMVTWLIGDYISAGIAGHEWEPAILWAYSEGLVGGVNANGDFNPEGTVSRAEACTILSRLIHPENRLTVDWTEAQRRSESPSTPAVRLADGTDFTGKSRIHYDQDVAYEFCRQLEQEIGIQIFYLPEFTEKEAGLLDPASYSSFPLDQDYFTLVLGELRKMKAAYDLYPDGFLKEMVSKKNPNRSTEIILCPYTFEGITSYGVHVYDYSEDTKKVDQIYYTGIGDTRYYSHEMGHMVMSCAAILGGWSKVCNDWETMNASATGYDYASAYAMVSRSEDWAETWASLWHNTDIVAAQMTSGNAPVFAQKVRYMTQLLDDCYVTFRTDQLPWSYLL